MCINCLKTDLYQIALNTGLNSKYTLDCSVQLDNLIMLYHQENEYNQNVE
ncbi:Spo0E family sporulation regulatory protein-aspartic acid phosphatase [Bacillus sp. AFS040349]